MTPTADDFKEALNKLFNAARQQGKEYVDVLSGDLHRQVGSYPGRNHRMPICCSVMKHHMKDRDVVLDGPCSGQGASLKIRYYLNAK
ncbi:MAG: HNH endonuclease [Actinobacteria bacterium]|nr:HNH endonuclease [Actinomycetota bacterium]